VVFDGPPEGLTPEVLTRIYGEEDWTRSIKREDEDDEPAPGPGKAEPERERLAGLT
jgi:phosphonate transport system ATP-binding protein